MAITYVDAYKYSGFVVARRHRLTGEKVHVFIWDRRDAEGIAEVLDTLAMPEKMFDVILIEHQTDNFVAKEVEVEVQPRVDAAWEEFDNGHR